MTRVRQGLLIWADRGWVPTRLGGQSANFTCSTCGATPAIVYRKNDLDFCGKCRPT